MVTSARLCISGAPPRPVPLGPRYIRERCEPAPLHHGGPPKGGGGGVLIEASPRRTTGVPLRSRAGGGPRTGGFGPLPAHHRHTGRSSPLADKELVGCNSPAIRRSSVPRHRRCQSSCGRGEFNLAACRPSAPAGYAPRIREAGQVGVTKPSNRRSGLCGP